MPSNFSIKGVLIRGEKDQFWGILNCWSDLPFTVQNPLHAHQSNVFLLFLFSAPERQLFLASSPVSSIFLAPLVLSKWVGGGGFLVSCFAGSCLDLDEPTSVCVSACVWLYVYPCVSVLYVCPYMLMWACTGVCEFVLLQNKKVCSWSKEKYIYRSASMCVCVCVWIYIITNQDSMSIKLKNNIWLVHYSLVLLIIHSLRSRPLWQRSWIMRLHLRSVGCSMHSCMHAHTLACTCVQKNHKSGVQTSKSQSNTWFSFCACRCIIHFTQVYIWCVIHVAHVYISVIHVNYYTRTLFYKDPFSVLYKLHRCTYVLHTTQVYIRCFALLARCTTGGHRGEKHREAWTAQYNKLMSTINSLLSQLYLGFQSGLEQSSLNRVWNSLLWTGFGTVFFESGLEQSCLSWVWNSLVWVRFGTVLWTGFGTVLCESGLEQSSLNQVWNSLLRSRFEVWNSLVWIGLE